MENEEIDKLWTTVKIQFKIVNLGTKESPVYYVKHIKCKHSMVYMTICEKCGTPIPDSFLLQRKLLNGGKWE